MGTRHALILLLASLPAVASDWLHTGDDEGGSRFSTLTQITPENVSDYVTAFALPD